MRLLLDRSGEPRWYGVSEDVQDRKVAEGSALERTLLETEEHYRWYVELSPQALWTAAPDGAIEEVGPLWLRLTGMSPENSLGAGWISALHPSDREPTLSAWESGLRSGVPIDIDFRIMVADRGYRWMRARGAPRTDEQGRIVRWYGSLEDIHEQKLTQQALAESEERFRLAVQAARLGIWDCDAISGERTWSTELRAMLGLTADREPTVQLALQLVHPEDRPHLRSILDAVKEHETPHRFEATLRIHRADTGELRWIKSVGWNSLSHFGRLARIIVTFQDVTEQCNADERIRWAATHDSLTRLPNRLLWQQALDERARQGQSMGAKFGLMVLDIDNLKRINDASGHDAGDALLRRVAQRLTAAAPPNAVVGRLGGGEFVIIAPSAFDARALKTCATDLVAALRLPYLYDGHPLECSASVGGSLFGEHGSTAGDLLKAADLALYAAKTSGSGRFAMFHSALRDEMQQRESMISMARTAISSDLIVPFYQPKVDLHTGRTVGYEALLRWRHPTLGIQSPANIRAAFENPDLAIELTERMLTVVTSDVKRWRQAGFDPGPVAVNTSAADFMQDDFAERVLAHLSDHDLPPSVFEIEVTEAVFLGQGAGYAERALRQLSGTGVRIALDDFGTGYASLSHLKHYPVNVLKIDRSFVSNIEHDRHDAAIVDAIVSLGLSMGLDIVAEGVETQNQVDSLLAHGCFIGQGYLLGLPRSLADILQN